MIWFSGRDKAAALKSARSRRDCSPEYDLKTDACHDSRQEPAGAGQIALPYLRVAQTYMLISMPTCTSTIFGVFQVIRFSQVLGATLAPT